MKICSLLLIFFCAGAIGSYGADAPAPLSLTEIWQQSALRPRAVDSAKPKGPGQVHWRAWDAATFAESAQRSKPLFVFVTAPWCHAGAGMEQTTFTDLEAATRLNEEFVPVHLDRDQRPDLDVRLQQMAHALNGSRGWPLLVCLTPRGTAFYATTFCEAEDDPIQARPGLRSLISAVVQAWRSDPAGVQDQAQTLETAWVKTLGGKTAGLPPADLLARVAETFQTSGFSGSGEAQFPAPYALELALTHYAQTGDARSLAAATQTLGGMICGGIYDQLGGGFHRCSSGQLWCAPRFEKQLRLNAEMIPACLHVWQATHKQYYLNAAEETLRFWLQWRDADGACFFSSLAADASPFSDEYYTWTLKDIETALPDETDCALAKQYYGIMQNIGWGPQPFRHVLFEAATLEQSAVQSGLAPAGASARLAEIRARLLRVRTQRTPPPVDRTLFVDANAMMAAAFLEAGSQLKNAEYLAQGTRTLQYLLQHALVRDAKGQLFALHQLAGGAATPALAQDEAALAYACTAALAATQDPAYALAAEESLRRLDQNFSDPVGGYFDRAASNKTEIPQCLAWSLKSYCDAAEPATNGLAALAWRRLGHLTGKEIFHARADAIVQAFGGALAQRGIFGATLILAAQR